MSEREIFLEAMNRADKAARAAYLDQACGTDAALRRRIEELLGFLDSDHSLLERRPAELLAAMSAGSEGGETAADTQDSDVMAALLALLAPTTHSESLGQLGPYHVLNMLGHGGFGIVVKAFDDSLQRYVAIKILAPHLAATSPPRKRFLREARAAAAVRHQHVVQIYAVQETPLPYMVMEFIEGQTLQQRLDSNGPFEAAEVVCLGQQIALGLAAAHDQGLIHRDVKPANILLEAGGVPCIKLTDFGLARAGDDASLTRSGIIAGSPLYMAPEQAGGTILDHRADLFSLGSVLYTIITGRPPFRAPTTLAVLKRVAEDTPRPIREVMANVPEGLCRVIDRLLSKKPADRFPSAREAAEALASCLSDPAAVRKRSSYWNAANTRRIGGALAVFLLLSGMVWVWGPKLAIRQESDLGSNRDSKLESKPENPPVKHSLQTVESQQKVPDEPSPQPPVAQPPMPAAGSAVVTAKTIENSLNMKLVYVEPGSFWMGSPEDEEGHSDDAPQHEVEITRGFYMGAFEVNQGEYVAVMETNPSTFSAKGSAKDKVAGLDTSRFPVESVSWFDAQRFVEQLDKLEKDRMPGWRYRLPTEAEWEYACRGGRVSKGRKVTSFHFGDSLSSMQANFFGTFPFGAAATGPNLQRPCPVGMYSPNALGLYDMHGNVSEWCADWYDKDSYGKVLRRDPTGPSKGTDHVLRGGGWPDLGRDCRSASRRHFPPSAWGGSLGFRVVLSRSEKEIRQ
ncbi:MAG: pknB 29 [Planctomycetaceae bacterium]|nr:pknB 29 [Planctomycetaceae bacterium]